MDPADLEREIHEALMRLRAPRAPGSLSPRVMTAVRAHLALPWYRRSWFSWPVGWQVAGVVAALVMVAAGAMLAPAALRGATAVTTVVAQNVSGALAWEPPESMRRLLEMAGAARVVWRTVLGPLVFYASVFAVVVGMVFALCAAALTRLTLGRATA
jgi:hypothetical protein